MQIRFERDPDDKYKEMLTRAGWRDRTEEEGIWTKQLPKEGEKWQAAADAERLFKRIANEIRADQGLGPVTFALGRYSGAPLLGMAPRAPSSPPLLPDITFDPGEEAGPSAADTSDHGEDHHARNRSAELSLAREVAWPPGRI